MHDDGRRCTKCILSGEIPKINFDEQGVCNFCSDAEKTIGFDAIFMDESKQKVARLFKDSSGKSEFDAIVCYSGGKDSTYVLKLAVEKYGLKVLAFTLDNGFIPDSAWKNINNVIASLGVEHHIFRPQRENFNAIVRASAFNKIYPSKTLTRISSICKSCISMVNITALRIALEKNIPFILAGFTPGQIPVNGIIYKNHYKFLEDSRKESLDKLRNILGSMVDDYFCIDKDLLNRVVSYPYNINLLCLEDITESEVKKQISPLGWSQPEDVDGCSSNCTLNTFNNFLHEEIFGYNPYEMELSHLIRKGLMDRNEALSKISDRPKDKLTDLMQTLSIDAQDIERIKVAYQNE